MPRGIYQRKPHSEETKAKMSKSHRGKKATQEARANMSAAQQGKVISEETRKKMSIANTGRVVSQETKAILSLRLQGNKSWTGRKHTEEEKTKIGDGNRGKVVSVETRQKLSAITTAKGKHPPDCPHCLALPTWNKTFEGKHHTEETKTVLSKKAKDRWADPEFKKKQSAKMLGRKTPTRIEVALLALTKEVYPEEEVIYNHRAKSGFFLDVAIPRLMLDFEADGVYWHNRPGAKERDRIRDHVLAKEGWAVFRFGQAELEANQVKPQALKVLGKVFV